jgi:hypothetical protein
MSDTVVLTPVSNLFVSSPVIVACRCALHVDQVQEVIFVAVPKQPFLPPICPVCASVMVPFSTRSSSPMGRANHGES